MKKPKTRWQKIEHWIVLIIFFGSIAFNIGIAIFGESLGLVKERADVGDTQLDCPPDPRYPC